MSLLYWITWVKTGIPKPSKSPRIQLIIQDHPAGVGAVVGEGPPFYKRLEHHFKSVTYYSSMIALTVHTQGAQVLEKLSKERNVLDNFF